MLVAQLLPKERDRRRYFTSNVLLGSLLGHRTVVSLPRMKAVSDLLLSRQLLASGTRLYTHCRV